MFPTRYSLFASNCEHAVAFVLSSLAADCFLAPEELKKQMIHYSFRASQIKLNNEFRFFRRNPSSIFAIVHYVAML